MTILKEYRSFSFCDEKGTTKKKRESLYKMRERERERERERFPIFCTNNSYLLKV